MAAIRKSFYKDSVAYELTEGGLSVTVLPQGGKIQSIRFCGKEYLWQTEGERYKTSPYDSLFEDGEFSGFDDMFPTVSACCYPDGPWKGTHLPDHGEVWSLPWDCAEENGSLALGVHGIRLPYRLEKRISLTADGLRIDYCAENFSPFPLKYIWAAHPLFVLEKDTRLEMPDAREIMNVYGGCKYLGEYGEHHHWPLSNDGRDMSLLDPSEACCNKYYVWNPLARNIACLRYPDGRSVTVCAPADAVPYLGIWVNEDGYGLSRQKNIAPEPCTGALDALDIAAKFGRVSVIGPKSQSAWYLSLTFE